MHRLFIYPITILLGLCLTTFDAHPESSENNLKSQVEKLYLNYRELDHIYKELHNVAVSEISGPDVQLSYIQKAYLFVSETNLVCYYQYRLLSITPYIRDDRRSDFFTLRVKGLDKAISESRDRINSLKLYYGFIDSKPARKLIDSAIGLIEGNIYIYEKIFEILRPQTNNPEKFNPKI